MKTHRDLDVWKDAMDLVIETYRVTKQFPKEELFSLTNQIRRAVVSVAANISEGAGRNSPKELRNCFDLLIRIKLLKRMFITI